MLNLTPFLLFDGNCAEAMEFYHGCLGGELRLAKLGDTEMKNMFPAEKHGRIINAYLKSGSVEFSATDWMAAPEYLPQPGNTYSMFIIGEGYEELRAVFDKLAQDRSPDRFQDLHDMPFGTYGQLIDKFGVHWTFKGDKRN